MYGQQSRAEKAIQKRQAQGRALSPRQNAVVQQRQRALMRRAFPTGESVRMFNGGGIEQQPIYRLLRQLKGQCAGNAPMPDFQSKIGATIAGVCSPARNAVRQDTFNFVEDRGVNMRWSGSIRLETENWAEGRGQDTTVTSRATSQATDARQTTESRTDTSGGSAEASGERGAASGTASMEGSQSRSQGATRTRTGQDTGHTEGSLETRDVNMTAAVKAYVTLECSFDTHWSDAVNPFMWGVHATDAVANPGPKSGEVGCGNITWVQNQGLR